MDMEDATAPDDLARWFRDLLDDDADRSAALDRAHFTLKNSGWLGSVVLHKYQCKRGCQIATVFSLDGMTLCAVRDYKYSAGLNESVSVEAARISRTLDGGVDGRHWPDHVHHLEALAEFDSGTGTVSVPLVCRHYRGGRTPGEILGDVEALTPGKPDKPTRL